MLSFTDRHDRFLARKVEEGVFATTSAAVAAALERMIEDDEAREAALAAMAEAIRAAPGHAGRRLCRARGGLRGRPRPARP